MRIKSNHVAKLVVASGLAIMVASCAAPMPKLKSVDEVKFYPKPTQEEAMQKINSYLENTLIDPYSAKVKCTDVSDKAWLTTGYGYEVHYGYIVKCAVNAKNRFGGYVGAKEYLFLMNGPAFEHQDIVYRTGLMSK